jgi:hypothetical protein
MRRALFRSLFIAHTILTHCVYAELSWGKFESNGCVGDCLRTDYAILWGIPFGQSWEDACSSMSTVINEQYFKSPTRCVNRVHNIYGEFDVQDESCCNTICYEDLGCFTKNPPFGGTPQRPTAYLPQSPEAVDTRFFLYQRNITNGTEINADKLGPFEPSLKTKFIIHGFYASPNGEWIANLRKVLLDIEELNVIVVDWSKGSGLPYIQATANTQIVGAEIAKLINRMIATRNSKSTDFHIIGYSLSAHIAGYVGQRVVDLGRITGLDPAGPFFQNTDPIVRLDPSDALFVDVVHTDAVEDYSLLTPFLEFGSVKNGRQLSGTDYSDDESLSQHPNVKMDRFGYFIHINGDEKIGFGMIQPAGHVDFYVNGGKHQPDCDFDFKLSLNFIDELRNSVTCSHSAVYKFYIDSIQSNKCKYKAYPCQSKEDFEKGLCIRCSAQGCNRMGYWASIERDKGTLYLNTKSIKASDFCQQYFLVTLKSSKIDGLKSAKGRFTIQFNTSTEQSSTELLDDATLTFTPDSNITRLIGLNAHIDTTNKIENVFISYTRTRGWDFLFYDDKWSFEYVEVLNGETQQSFKYCPIGTKTIGPGQTATFSECSSSNSTG